MEHTDLLEQGSSESQIQPFPLNGGAALITVRIPKSLKEINRLHGVNFLAFANNRLINRLSGRQ